MWRIVSAYVVCSVVASWGMNLWAEERTDVEVVVTANRVETLRNRIGSSVTLITSDEIKRSQKRFVSDLLRSVPGVDVVRSGGAGGNTSIFLRGSNSEHTLVLLDGIELNNPVNNARGFNFSDLTLDNVERIEILRGPQSTLYGSDAIGGVINIITRVPENGTSGRISSEGGSYDHFVEKGALNYGHDVGGFNLDFTREDEGGVSAADADGFVGEQDGFDNSTLSFRGRLTPDEYLVFDNEIRMNRSHSEIDNSGGIFGDDLNRELKNEQLFWKSSLSADLLEGKWTPTLSFSQTYHRLNDDNDPDPIHTIDFQRSHYSGDLQKIEFQNSISISDVNHLVLGVEREEESASSYFFSDGLFGEFEDTLSKRNSRTTSYFLDTLWMISEQINLSVGGRIDDTDSSGSEFTFRVSPVVSLGTLGTRLRGAVSTGFKAPSLFQLYSSYGNDSLQPEEVTGWETGVDQPLFGGVAEMGITYFQQETDHLITFDDQTFIFENIDQSESSGFEVYMAAEPMTGIEFRIDYTYLDARNETTHEQLYRRARNRISGTISYRSSGDSFEVGSTVRFIGRRYDRDFSEFPAVETVLGGYGIVDVFSTYQLMESLSVFARVENLFDREYQEVFGFGTYGVAAYGGFEWQIG
ncbi:MAG: TonB-dependent receptor [Bdellovibrionales bacterium]|nr:TonB-dependent receptor [Bdellovibrionales bacterium]